MKRAHKKIITAMIPAKIKSTRLPIKNLALINGKPLIYYAIKAAKDAGVFDRIIVNAEDDIFEEIADRYNVDFYKRPDYLVKPTTKTDSVVYDFLKKHQCDILAWVSPIAPLQPHEELKNMVEYFVKNSLDSLMTVKNEQVHCIYNGKPVNFRIDEIFAQTQDLAPVKAFVYSTMMWRSSAFMKAFKQKGRALLCGKIGYFTVSKLSSIIVKKHEDLMLADYIMRAVASGGGYRVKYDALAARPKRKVS